MLAWPNLYTVISNRTFYDTLGGAYLVRLLSPWVFCLDYVMPQYEPLLDETRLTYMPLKRTVNNVRLGINSRL